MQSHTYDLTVRDLARLILPTLTLFALGAAALHALAWFDWLPEKPITLYADESVLRHQAKASLTHHSAKIVLVGDSTCHASVDAAALSQQLPNHTPAINLGLIIGIDFSQYGQIASDFAATNPNQVRWVVVLISPVRLATRGEKSFWKQIRDEARLAGKPQPYTFSINDIAGSRLLRERLAGRLLPEPLHSKGAHVFGFTTGLDAYMTAHDGSVVDFGEFKPRPGKAVAELAVAEDFAAACRNFRVYLPKNIKLAVGLTPDPTQTAPSVVREQYREYLDKLNQFLQPDVLLTNLPVTLPTSCFSQTAHLNVLGQQIYTTMLAKELARLP